jgi:anti-anti-sigma factor
MRLTEKIRDNIIVMFPEGYLDIRAVMVLEKFVNISMEENPECHVLLDLGSAGYVSSSCMRLFVEMHGKLTRKGLNLVLYNPNPITNRVLKITGIANFISVCENQEQALASLELN